MVNNGQLIDLKKTVFKTFNDDVDFTTANSKLILQTDGIGSSVNNSVNILQH